MNGYFENKGSLGKVTVSGFKFTIKSLSTEYQAEFDFEVKQWDKLLSLCLTGNPIKFLLCNFLSAK